MFLVGSMLLTRVQVFLNKSIFTEPFHLISSIWISGTLWPPRLAKIRLCYNVKSVAMPTVNQLRLSVTR